MQHSQTHLRSRPISAGHLRAFEAVARHLNFRAAAEEMALTQSAVSRQIQSLEEEVGVALFLRHTRAVELTSAGAQLLLAVQQSLPRIDTAVRQIRQSAGRKSVSLTTFASFASMWLIPRLEAFQRDNPEIDIRIDASDVAVDLEAGRRRHRPALRPARGHAGHGGAPLRRNPDARGKPLAAEEQPAHQDAGRHCRLHAHRGRRRAPHRTSNGSTWRRWFEVNGLERAQPKRWLYFNVRLPDGAGRAHRPGRDAGAQLADRRKPGQRRPGGGAAAAPHGFADGRPADRRAQRNALRPEIRAFWDWLQAQAITTRETIGEVPDPDTVDNID